MIFRFFVNEKPKYFVYLPFFLPSEYQRTPSVEENGIQPPLSKPHRLVENSFRQAEQGAEAPCFLVNSCGKLFALGKKSLIVSGQVTGKNQVCGR